MIVLKYIFAILVAFLAFDSYIFGYGNLNPKEDYSVGKNYENVFLRTKEGYLYKCWYIKTQGQEQKPVILYFLGNGGFIEGNIKIYDKLVMELDVDIFSCSNRGSGSNEGKATEIDLYSDAEMYINYLKKRNPPHIFVFGRSMGGAVAIELAHKHQDDITGLIVQNTFLSLKKLAKYSHAFLYFFLINYNLIIRSKMDNESKIKEINIPTLINVSLMDEVVPPFHSELLYKLSTSKIKVLYSSLKGTHNNITKGDGRNYYVTFKEFINNSIAARENREREQIAIAN
ncbi:conserved Plasmodium protein, unknown function [Plasmodium relictum]|uniref:Serine aminopeptidase S33 domain-containing protein n=1 Tax=Plasmodium relictum TaxID=85471 RepID=A0A1J1H1V2_PLARL|nr:conserved Plasmodium protein, unknown function [Plasmodium relictum]CRG98896.1 conserved Plasmodium protein, unknown function [Plasmodium relictum]